MQDIIPPRNHRMSRPAPRPVESLPPRVLEREFVRRSIRMTDGISISPQSSSVSIVFEEKVTVSIPPASDVSKVSVQKTVASTENYQYKPNSLTVEQKAHVLENALVRTSQETTKERRKTRDLKQFVVILTAGLLVILTSYVSIDTLVTNSRAKEGVDQKTQQAFGSTDAQTLTQAQEGQNETEPPKNSLTSYNVSPELPRALYIDKLKVASRILPMSINSDDSVQTPHNIFDSGWYSGSVKPGEIGAAFIVGHASGPTRQGLFAYLDTLVEGDTFQIEKGNGVRLTYKVVHVETVPLEGLDMRKVLLPQDGVLRGLNLMTCTGKWIEDKKTYDQRIVVYAEQV